MRQILDQIFGVLGQVGHALVTAEAVLVIASAILGAIAMFLVLNYLFEVVAGWRIFEKAGERGWKSLIPVYNNYIRYSLAWRPLWFWVSAVLMIASIVLGRFSGQNVVADGAAIAVGAAGWLIPMASRWKLARAFGRGVPFALGMALLPALFTLILGLGGSEYRRKTEEGNV